MTAFCWSIKIASVDLGVCEMKQRVLVALVGLPLLYLVLFVLPPMAIPVAIGLLSAIATFEMTRALGASRLPLRVYLMVLSGLVPLWIAGGSNAHLALTGTLCFVFLFYLEAFRSAYAIQIKPYGAAVFYALLVPYFLSAILRIGLLPLRNAYVLLPLIIPFLTDILAMFSGMFFGKHKLAPSISPKKTVEGSVGGLLGALVGVLIYGYLVECLFALEVNYLFLAIYALLGSLFAQMGDLSFSYIKRQEGIKDFGSIFPGHGGVLDRFDSVIFCAPLVELLICLLPAVSG